MTEEEFYAQVRGVYQEAFKALVEQLERLNARLSGSLDRIVLGETGKLLVDGSGSNVIPTAYAYPSQPSDYTTTDSWADAFTRVDKAASQNYMSGEIDLHLFNVHASNGLDYQVEVSKDDANWLLGTPMSGSEPASGSIPAGESKHVLIYGAGGRYYRVRAKSSVAGQASTLRTRHYWWVWRAP